MEEDNEMTAIDTPRDGTTTSISIPYIESERPHLHAKVGPCRLKIVPGEGTEWVTGSYSDPSRMLPLHISQEGDTVTISQDHDVVEIVHPGEWPPTLDLVLANGAKPEPTPYALTLETGISECLIDLGGLPLVDLVVKQGAGKVQLEFSRPNPGVMRSLRVGAGASGMELRKLANANFGEMVVEGGAVSYLLEFGGTLRRDASLSISTAMAGVDLYVPATTSAKVVCTSFLGGVSAGEGFVEIDGIYYSRPALEGRKPLLSVTARVTMAGLNLHTE
jgi:hypothetical protein